MHARGPWFLMESVFLIPARLQFSASVVGNNPIEFDGVERLCGCGCGPVRLVKGQCAAKPHALHHRARLRALCCAQRRWEVRYMGRRSECRNLHSTPTPGFAVLYSMYIRNIHLDRVDRSIVVSHTQSVTSIECTSWAGMGQGSLAHPRIMTILHVLTRRPRSQVASCVSMNASTRVTNSVTVLTALHRHTSMHLLAVTH
jgi:hypothetical protein